LRRSCLALTAVAAIALGCPSQPQAEVFDLRPTGLAGAPGELELLRYIVRCALPSKAAARVSGDREAFRLSGELGLAPDWQHRALAPEERRLVSPCVLALANAYGVSVRISLRADPGLGQPPPSLRASASERAAFPLYEGAFFGDIFSAGATAYACSGDRSPHAVAQLQRLRRVCALPTGARTADGRDVSACGFVIVGPCKSDVFGADGVHLLEPIHVYVGGN
jgi:hypothetical protein